MIAEFKKVLGNPKFVYLWMSQLLSQLTINVTNFLLLLRLFSVTGSTIATSLLWISYSLPAILVGPFAAASVDIFDRRKMLMLTNFLQAAAIFLYAVTKNPSIFLLYGLAMTYSFLNQFYVPAEAASLPSIVSKKFLPQANSIFFLTQQGALVLGFAGAGVLNHFLGFSTSLFIGAGFLFVAFVSVSFLPPLMPSRQLPSSLEKGLEEFFVRILEGYRFIKENRHVLLPLLLLLGVQIVVAMLVVNIPIITQDILGLPASVGMVFLACSAGLGAASGALLISRLIKVGWRKKKLIENFLMILGIFVLMFVVLATALNGSPKLIALFVSLFVMGICFIGIVVPAQTFLQEKIPGGLRGRVFGNYFFLAMIVTIFPVIFSGAITELFGIKLMIFMTGIIAITFSLVSKRYGQNFLEKEANDR
jgi:MFS family permease